MPIKSLIRAPSADESAAFLATNSAHRAARLSELLNIEVSVFLAVGARLEPQDTSRHRRASIAGRSAPERSRLAAGRSRSPRTGRNGSCRPPSGGCGCTHPQNDSVTEAIMPTRPKRLRHRRAGKPGTRPGRYPAGTPPTAGRGSRRAPPATEPRTKCSADSIVANLVPP